MPASVLSPGPRPQGSSVGESSGAGRESAGRRVNGVRGEAAWRPGSSSGSGRSRRSDACLGPSPRPPPLPPPPAPAALAAAALGAESLGARLQQSRGTRKGGVGRSGWGRAAKCNRSLHGMHSSARPCRRGSAACTAAAWLARGVDGAVEAALPGWRGCVHHAPHAPLLGLQQRWQVGRHAADQRPHSNTGMPLNMRSPPPPSASLPAHLALAVLARQVPRVVLQPPHRDILAPVAQHYLQKEKRGGGRGGQQARHTRR